jgi:hypothetical protein
VATGSHENALAMAASLGPEERMRLIQALTPSGDECKSPEPPHSILELRGLGKETWEGIDAQKYLDNERASWNG